MNPAFPATPDHPRSQSASASICERINSEFAFIKDPRRNRLEHTKANKLVAIFHNLRLLHRMRMPKYSEPAVGWNHEDEKSGVTKYGKIAHYEPPKHKTICAPVRLMLEGPTQGPTHELLALM